MAKNIIEDVRPPRSIRDIPLPDGRKPRQNERQIERQSDEKPKGRSAERPTATESGVEQEEHIAHEERLQESLRNQRTRSTPIRNSASMQDINLAYHMDDTNEVDERRSDFSEVSHRSPVGRYILWGLAVICIIALFFGVSFFFTSAIVTVTPKTEAASIDTSLPIGYQVLTFTASSSAVVPAHGQVAVSQKASGQIVVYNDYSASPETLIATTRFETPNGLIYRTPTQITIPGKKGSTPGSLTITVYADQPGANYNIGLSDFTIPGLQTDTAKYNAMYGRSKTVMTGGESGTVPNVLAGDKTAAEDILVAQLQSRLNTLAQSQTPSPYFFSESTATTTFKELPSTASVSATATSSVITEQGMLTAVVFDQSQFASALASSSLPDYDGNPVTVQAMNQLSINLADPSILANPLSGTAATTTIVVSGPATFVWQYSSDDLINALKGKSSTEIPSILTNFPEITKADVVIKPFWISTLPSNADKIKVITAVSSPAL